MPPKKKTVPTPLDVAKAAAAAKGKSPAPAAKKAVPGKKPPFPPKKTK